MDASSPVRKSVMYETDVREYRDCVTLIKNDLVV